MKRCVAIALLALVLGLPEVRAEHARITLTVSRPHPTGNYSMAAVLARAHADQEPPRGGVNPRPVAKVKAGEALILQFFLDNTYPHGENKGVVVRYFIARETKLGQKTLPDLAKGMVTQGRIKMNFKPKCRVGTRVVFTIPKPGIYLLRLDTENTNSDHEHFSAIDVQVE